MILRHPIAAFAHGACRTVSLLMLSALVCSTTSHSAPTEDELPLKPSIDRDVSLIHNKQFTRPHIPPVRTTRDGRVGMQTKTRTSSPNDGVFDFYLLAPEKLNRHFPSSDNGANILASTTPYTLPRRNFITTNERGESVHSAICEVSDTPRSCGADGSSDCYRFKVITPFRNDQRDRIELWSTPVEVTVRNPKTADAQIDDIVTGTPTRGVVWPGINILLETVVTDDGRLLVGRVAGSTLNWRDSSTRRARQTQPNVIYSFAPLSAAPCDVTAFSTPYPITHAFHHEIIRNRYGFAKYPLRNGTGGLIPNGADFGGSYPWLDNKGNNLFFGTFSKSFQENGRDRFLTRCVEGGVCSNPAENGTADTIGIAVAGLWTKGQTVLLDNAMNNIDWNLQARPEGHVNAKLYRGDNGWVHIGTGRDNTNDNASHMPPGGTGNINIIDSITNRFNALPAFRPSVPRDVAWWVSAGKATDVVAFDDWLNATMLISSDMAQAIEGTALEPSNTRLQNAATSRRFTPPAFGQILGGRIEPVALGGVRGKGYFARAEGGIRYTIPANTAGLLERQDWYLGVFVDARFGDDGQSRRLIEFPDLSAIELVGLTRIAYVTSDNTRTLITLPSPLRANVYEHLAFRVLQSGELELFVNGVLTHTWTRPANAAREFRIAQGDLYLGRGRNNTSGFIGWLDEFKVLASADRLNAEEFCNYASGSIVGVTDRADSQYRNKASRLSRGAIDLIQENLSMAERHSGYHCFTENRSADGWINLRELPVGLVGLREAILFPEGPLHAAQPRPDSSQNDFCLGCHRSDGSDRQPPSLGINALMSRDMAAKLDPRRQPSQAPARIFGHLPADTFGRALPAFDGVFDAGVYVDDYLLP